MHAYVNRTAVAAYLLLRSDGPFTGEKCTLHVQVGLLRLTTMAAKLAPNSRLTDGSRLMLWFLQCLLAHCLSAIITFVAGEVQAVLGPRPDVMDSYLGKGASLCSRQAREPGETKHSMRVTVQERGYTPSPEYSRLSRRAVSCSSAVFSAWLAHSVQTNRAACLVLQMLGHLTVPICGKCLITESLRDS